LLRVSSAVAYTWHAHYCSTGVPTSTWWRRWCRRTCAASPLSGTASPSARMRCGRLCSRRSAPQLSAWGQIATLLQRDLRRLRREVTARAQCVSRARARRDSPCRMKWSPELIFVHYDDSEGGELDREEERTAVRHKHLLVIFFGNPLDAAAVSVFR